jgi:hypothetical protein
MNKILKSMLVVALGVALYAPQALAAAFGVSPPWVTNENLKPGSNYVYVIDLSTNDPSQEMVVTAKVTGDPEVQKWVTIKDKDNLTMPIGMQHVPMYVEVNIPQDARVGKYAGNISLVVAPRNLNPNNVSILLGGNIAVNLKVVNYDVVDYWVKSISAQPIIEGQPIMLNVELKNLGNTVISSLETKVQVLDFKTEKVLSTFSGGTLNKPVYPQTLDTAQINLPVEKLAAGAYWLKVDTLKNGRSVYSNKLYQEVAASSINGAVQTSVQVALQGETIQPAAPVAPQNYGMPVVNGQNVQLRTTVTVRAPFTNQLIMIVIGLLLVIVGISARIYRQLKGPKHHAHHHHR